MSPLMYHIAGGACLLPALATLLGAVASRWRVRSRWAAVICLAVALLAVGMIVASSPAMDAWIAWPGVVCLVAWATVRPRSARRIFAGRSVPTIATAAFVFIAGAIEVDRERVTALPSGSSTTLTVVGDSISAGLGRPGEVTWPARLRMAHGIHLNDLSRPGCTVRQAVIRSQAAAVPDGVVVIEVGGNDLIGRADPAQFGTDLDALARTLTGPGRQVVMFELPRFPLADAYGHQQRRVARQHRILLVPRRTFAAVLAEPGNTVDGIHLSNAGQQRTSELVWRVVGPALSR